MVLSAIALVPSFLSAIPLCTKLRLPAFISAIWDKQECTSFYFPLITAPLIVWQTAELGKVDAGGGGTVAKYLSKLNIDTVDLGVPVLSMHAPYEVISKADLYSNYKAFLAFMK